MFNNVNSRDVRIKAEIRAEIECGIRDGSEIIK